jgi:ubiquitin-conjugating enzyme E2 J1
MDVCLSVTKYHKEDWQPAWTSNQRLILVRTILEAIIAFFPVKEDHSAIGAIDYPIEIRKKLATASQKWSCDKCG